MTRSVPHHSVEQIQPDLLIPTGKRKGQNEAAHAAFAAPQASEVPGPRIALPDRASL